MDLNRAFSAHQIALIRASCSGDPDEREHLREVADHIADHIAWYKGRYGAPGSAMMAAAALAQAPSS